MIIASNRLPVSISGAGGARPSLVPSAGGLASAMRQIHEAGEGEWVGWLGDSSKISAEQLATLYARAKDARLSPVSLSPSEVALYCDGYSNGVLWPLFHYLVDKVRLDASREWRAYVQVNRRFAEAIAAALRPGDSVWIHDYQLALVPALLRQHSSAVRVGFFLHIPLPSSDVFRILPSRVEILKGLLGADLLGFQTEAYRQNFLQSTAEVLGVDLGTETVAWEGRQVRVGVYPIGIDVVRYSERTPATATMVEEIRRKTATSRCNTSDWSNQFAFKASCVTLDVACRHGTSAADHVIGLVRRECPQISTPSCARCFASTLTPTRS